MKKTDLCTVLMLNTVENYPSKLFEKAVMELSKLPGVGKRTALRFALHLLKQSEEETLSFAGSISELRTQIKYCKVCHSISDNDLCDICATPVRDHSIICVVENVQDIMALENTRQYKGIYHVLGGVLSPMEGVGIHDLNIDTLLERLKNEDVKEIILALPTTVEGDTTSFFLHKQLKLYNITISTIARGIAVGDNLEFADEVTLGRSILNRMPFEGIYRHSL